MPMYARGHARCEDRLHVDSGVFRIRAHRKRTDARNAPAARRMPLSRGNGEQPNFAQRLDHRTMRSPFCLCSGARRILIQMPVDWLRGQLPLRRFRGDPATQFAGSLANRLAPGMANPMVLGVLCERRREGRDRKHPAGDRTHGAVVILKDCHTTSTRHSRAMLRRAERLVNPTRSCARAKLPLSRCVPATNSNRADSAVPWFEFAPPKESDRQWVDQRSAKELAKAF